MCRIVGGLDFKGGGVLKENIISMRDSMHLGGPNGAGVYFDKNLQAVLAHRRLSIIDLSDFSNQPFMSLDGRYALVFNGEIYNHKEVAQELRQNGVEIDTKSDTQVLLESFIFWGESCVTHFDGMFAFCIWDSIEQKLFLCRDRFGAKPLYYYFDGDIFLFASELKAFFSYPKLKKKINKQSLSYFLSYGYIPAPHCILESCYKLESGCFLWVDRNANLQKHCYYNPRDFFAQKQDFNEVEFKERLYTSVERRMVSDVPVGVLLSGGVDSSLVCAVLKDLGYTFETFTMGFKEASFNEGKYAKEVADILGLKNLYFECLIEDAKGLVENLTKIYDEPFGDSSAIPTLLLSQKIAENYKVVLSADGGDELGLGYDRYFWAKDRWDSYKKWRILSGGALFSALSPKIGVEILQKLGISMGMDKFLRIKNQLKAKNFMEHYRVEISHLRKEDFAKSGVEKMCENLAIYAMDDDFDTMSYYDLRNYLSEDILTKTDRASMSVGLEIREPLLGVDFVNYMLSLKSVDKINHQGGKALLKRYLEKFLPKDLIYRPKMGFGVPLESWMRGELRYLLDDILEYSEDYVDEGYVKSLLDDFVKQKRVDFAKIWYLYVFCAWRKEWKI